MRLKNYCGQIQSAQLSHLMVLWKNELQEEYNFLLRFLYPTDELAVRYPKDPWCDYRVVYYPDGRIAGIDDEDVFDRVKLTRADVLCHKFDLKEFRHEMCDGFGLIPSPVEIGNPYHGIPWGTWEPEKGAAFPVTLLGGSLDFRGRVSERILRRKAPGEILIIPTRLCWTSDLDELARENKVLLVPLNEIVQMEDDKLQPTPEWDEYLTAFCKMIEMDLPSSLQGTSHIPPYEFRKKGEVWIVRFEGEETYLKDSVGLQCIGQLLTKPRDPVFVMELRAILNGQKLDSIAQPSTREDVVDQETLTDLKRRYLELQSELEEAQRDGNEIIEAEIEQEMEKIIHYLGQVKAINGESRKVNDDFEKARSATSKAFWRSVNQIRGDLPRLAAHLEKSCVVGMVCNYSPERKIDWVL